MTISEASSPVRRSRALHAMLPRVPCLTESRADMTLFPAFLKLQGRPVLIVGGGPIAEQKLAGLIDSEALVTLVAPQITDAIREQTRAGSIQWIAREFR